jgi:hypothetical protein
MRFGKAGGQTLCMVTAPEVHSGGELGHANVA